MWKSDNYSSVGVDLDPQNWIKVQHVLIKDLTMADSLRVNSSFIKSELACVICVILAIDLLQSNNNQQSHDDTAGHVTCWQPVFGAPSNFAVAQLTHWQCYDYGIKQWPK